MSAYTLAGQVTAIQWTGTNLTELTSMLTGVYDVFSSPTSTALLLAESGASGGFTGFWLGAGDWLVSRPAYGATVPAFGGPMGGDQVVGQTGFAQTYTAV